MNYKRRPIEVQALEWKGDNLDLIRDFMVGADKVLVEEVNGDLKLFSLDGYMTCHQGDYIIRTKFDEVYPCSKHRFEDIYEPVQ